MFCWNTIAFSNVSEAYSQ